MLSLDQVRLLENRVIKAVGKIESLTTENTHLRAQLSGLQTRVSELEGVVRSFKDDQGRIEEGILSALDRLSAFEDSMYTNQIKETETVKPAAESILEPELPAYTEEPTIADTDRESLSPQTAIEASWATSGDETSAAVSPDNGQMDIF